MIRLPFWRDESGAEMAARIRSEIKRENEKKLSDPSLYLNSPKNLDGAIDDEAKVIVV